MEPFVFMFVIVFMKELVTAFDTDALFFEFSFYFKFS